jgi:ZIP family zinc transporter
MFETLLITLVPAAVTVLGAAIATWRRPNALMTSALQHFAAGVVFAAAAVEILPNLKHAGSVWPVVIGGGAGLLVMLAIEELGRRTKGQTGLITLIAVDVLIDGLVLGLGFAAGEKAGILLTVALTLEVLFLGLALSTELMEEAMPAARIIAITAAIALLLPIGALLAAPIATLSPAVVKGFFAFGLIALLYLVTEELLVEAHEVPERPWITAMFFVGFLLLFLLEEAIA